MFIMTEATADPARLKFLPGCEVLGDGTLDLRDKTQAAASPLAQRLFAMPEVAGVFLGKDFVIVTKGSGDWQHLKPAIFGAIMEHFRSGAPVVCAPTPSLPRGAEENGKAEAVDRVREALRQVIDPELGYNVVDLGLVYDVVVENGGTVRIIMTTTTPGCPATNYLKRGVGEAASAVPGVEFVDVTLTYEPRWAPEMMSPQAKAHFGITDGGSR
ncbi:MAG: NifU N-terminal domain-containing protein [Pseudolabrys sp.]|nr:NifU N-terminal domain-containing protein [Pseudolabrys sp.]